LGNIVQTECNENKVIAVAQNNFTTRTEFYKIKKIEFNCPHIRVYAQRHFNLMPRKHSRVYRNYYSDFSAIC